MVRKQTNALIIILILILGILARKHFEIQVITKISEKETLMFLSILKSLSRRENGLKDGFSNYYSVKGIIFF